MGQWSWVVRSTAPPPQASTGASSEEQGPSPLQGSTRARSEEQSPSPLLGSTGATSADLEVLKSNSQVRFVLLVYISHPKHCVLLSSDGRHGK